MDGSEKYVTFKVVVKPFELLTQPSDVGNDPASD